MLNDCTAIIACSGIFNCDIALGMSQAIQLYAMRVVKVSGTTNKILDWSELSSHLYFVYTLWHRHQLAEHWRLHRQIQQGHAEIENMFTVKSAVNQGHVQLNSTWGCYQVRTLNRWRKASHSIGGIHIHKTEGKHSLHSRLSIMMKLWPYGVMPSFAFFFTLRVWSLLLLIYKPDCKNA